jgi:hypothetical protein
VDPLTATSGGDQLSLNRAMTRLVGLLIVLSAVGCSATDATTRAPKPSVKAGEFGAADCFYSRQAQDFKVLDDHNLIVFAPSRTSAYHVVISPPSSELRFANAMGFESRNTRICGYAGDRLLLADGPGARPYAVMGVYRLDEAALQGLSTRFGVGEAPVQTEPQPADGADIEKDLDGNDPTTP